MTAIIKGHGARIDDEETFVPQGVTLKFYSDFDVDLATPAALIALLDGAQAPAQEEIVGTGEVGDVNNYILGTQDDGFSRTAADRPRPPAAGQRPRPACPGNRAQRDQTRRRGQPDQARQPERGRAPRAPPALGTHHHHRARHPGGPRDGPGFQTALRFSHKYATTARRGLAG